MTKTLIDVDDELLAAAQLALGSASKKETVNRALGEVAAIAARRRDLERLTKGGSEDLLDLGVMAGAWQR